MSHKKNPPPDDGPPERLTLEQFKILAAQAADQPEKISALKKRLVFQTIDEVREGFGAGGQEGGSPPPDARAGLRKPN